VLHGSCGKVLRSFGTCWSTTSVCLRCANQIPWYPRASRDGARTLYDRLGTINKFNEEFVTHRCPADAVAAWNHVYKGKVRTSSKVVRSMRVQLGDITNYHVDPGVQILVMYQHDKQILLKRFNKVCTVGEAEGKTYERVLIVRLDTQSRPLYNSEPHVLVATSRHTQECVALFPNFSNNLLEKYFANAEDIRLTNSCRDIESAGHSLFDL